MNTLPWDTTNWLLPNQPTTITSTLPNYEEALPVRVNHEGMQNYLKNRGSLNLGVWATEGKRTPIPTISKPIIAGQNVFNVPPPKVLGNDAIRNYVRSRSSTPNLIYDNADPPREHHQMRVKKEARANYEKNQNSQSKFLMDNYGKLPIPTLPAPHTMGQKATDIFHMHKQGIAGSVIHDPKSVPVSPRLNPNVIGFQAENNLQKSLGDIDMLDHKIDRPTSTPEPHIFGTQAHANYDNAQGRSVNQLFNEYGKLPQSTQAQPKVKYGGVNNLNKARGDAMRKAISQCPPSYRRIERLQSVPS